jgi:hypothetical protein
MFAMVELGSEPADGESGTVDGGSRVDMAYLLDGCDSWAVQGGAAVLPRK